MEDWKNWSPEELELQVSPSRWRPAKSPTVVIDEFIRTTLKATQDAIATVPNELNLIYGSSKKQKLDLYGTDLPSNAPVFVFIHGGYWQEGSKDISGGMAGLNHARGIKTAEIGYTLAPDATIQEMEAEIIDSLEYLVKLLPEAKLILSGHSAGGQLAAHLLHTPTKPLSNELYQRIIGFVLISGVFDLRPIVNTYVNLPLKMTMTEAEARSALLNANFNPEMNKQQVHILVIVGAFDSPEFQRQSQQYFEKLLNVFPNTSFWKSETDDHFTLIENLVDDKAICSIRILDFLKKLVES